MRMQSGISRVVYKKYHKFVFSSYFLHKKVHGLTFSKRMNHNSILYFLFQAKKKQPVAGTF